MSTPSRWLDWKPTQPTKPDTETRNVENVGGMGPAKTAKIADKGISAVFAGSVGPTSSIFHASAHLSVSEVIALVGSSRSVKTVFC